MRLLLLSLAASLLVGCVGVPVNITSERPPHINPAKERYVKGHSAGFQFLYIFPFSMNSRHARAYEQLKANAGNDYVYDVEVLESWRWAFVGTVYSTHFRAKTYPRDTVAIEETVEVNNSGNVDVETVEVVESTDE